MSIIYTPTGGVFHTTVTLVSNTDPVTAPGINDAGIKYLADNAAYLEQRQALSIAQGTTTAQRVPGNGSAEIQRQVAIVPFLTDGPNWASSVSTGVNTVVLVYTAVNTYGVFFPLPWDFFNRGNMVRIACQLEGAAGHLGLPATMPELRLYEAGGPNSVGGTLLASCPDTSASVAAYEQAHNIEATFSAPINNRAYYLRFTGEQGVNSLPDLQLYRMWVGVTG